MSHPAGSPGASPAQQMQKIYTQASAPSPAKRPRLSPEAQPPVPGYQNGGYRPPLQSQAHSVYGNPYAAGPGQHQSYAQQYSPQQAYPPNAFNTPDHFPGARPMWQPQPSMQQVPRQNAASPSSSQMMPPPPKPNKEEREKVGVDDMNDMLYSAGINLKDEENYVQNLYNNRQLGDSFATQQGSFSSSQGGSLNMLTQSTSFSTQPNGAGAGTMGATMSQDEVENELKHKRAYMARKKAEYDQHHLKNPFLLGNVLRERVEKGARLNAIRLNTAHLHVLNKDPQPRVMMNADGTEGVVAVAASSIITAETAPIIDILSLLSLAAGERVRGLLDESHGLARARRFADQGRVPPDFSDIADGSGQSSKAVEVIPESISGSPWDQAPDGAAKPQTTVSFQSAVNRQLRSLARAEEDAEAARARKREARKKAAAAAAANDDDASAVDALADAAALEASAQPKISKKELARQQKERQTLTEAQASASTNQTAALAVGLGGKTKKYSWMTGGAASMPTNRYAKPTPAPSAPGSGSGTPSRAQGARTPVGVRKNVDNNHGMAWGEWRENNAGGRGIQVRDWLLVLERDGRQKKAWERTQLRLNGPAPPPPTSIVR